MKNIVVFCQAYAQIKNTIYLLDTNWEKNSLTLVIIKVQDLFKFFKIMNEKVYSNKIKMIFIKDSRNLINLNKTKNNIVNYLDKFYKEKLYLKKIYKQYFSLCKNSIIYFSSRHYTDYSFYFIDKLRKNNQLIHFPDPGAYLLPNKPNFPVNLPDIVKLVIWKMIYGIRISIGKHSADLPDATYPMMSDIYMNKMLIQTISISTRDKLTSKIDYNNYNLWDVDNFDVMYFGHDAKNIRSSKEIYKKELHEIFKILTKYYKTEKIASKYHPGRINDSKVKIGSIFDQSIPAEFLINNNTKIYITVFSSAISNIENGTIISLFKLISVREKSVQDSIIDRLIKMSKKRILFPSSLDEFENILINSRLN